ncbi:MAG: hypothetical protein IJ003_04750 [Candidatus Gastranaerophilales bacterium]|nr:hypothetical protein [Candidatus Gastranaerophilales bacterium]
MGISIKKFLLLTRGIKLITPFLSFAYFATWCLRFFDKDFYKIFDSYLGAFPNLLDKIFLIESDIKGIEVTMGYVLAAGIVVTIALLSFKLENKLEKLAKLEEDDELRRRFEAQRALQKEKEQQKERVDLDKMEMYFGLFEIKLTYYDELYKNKNDLVELKKEYAKLLESKIKEKYQDIEIDSTDGIFFSYCDFSKFHTIVKDFVRLYNVLAEINKQKCIQTDLLFSFWADKKQANHKGIRKILDKINGLGYFNKVILSGGVYFRYQKEKEKHFDFVSLGVSKLFNALDDDEDIDVNLICIRNMK